MGLDDPVPEQGYRETYGEDHHQRPVALAEARRLDPVQCYEGSVEGQQVAARRNAPGADVLGRLYVELVLLQEVRMERASRRCPLSGVLRILVLD